MGGSMPLEDEFVERFLSVKPLEGVNVRLRMLTLWNRIATQLGLDVA